MRVLIVDDDRDTVMTLGILLRSEGFHVRLVQSGNAVPDAVRSFYPEVVLLDIAMPDRDGYDLARELTRRYGSACPTLIALTARSTEADRQLAMQSGFQHHVAKPYDPHKLLQLLASLVASS